MLGDEELRGSTVRVVVAMLTYNRPSDLVEAIPAVLAQLEDVPGEASLLVVDNDPQGSAMSVHDRFGGAPLRFVHEPEPGIARARNRALDSAGDAEALVFIDDDERPEPGWLAALVSMWERTGAAAVVGPVRAVFATPPDPWITDGGFFERRTWATGAEVTAAGTGNLLLDLRVLRELGLRFDTTLGTRGSEDTLLTRQLHRRGGRIVWCAEAQVVDMVPEHRLTRRWVLLRAFSSGNAWSRSALAVEEGAGRRWLLRLRLCGAGAIRMGGGAIRALVGSVVRSRRHQARGARTLVRGAGMAAGAWGYSYNQYRRRAT